MFRTPASFADARRDAFTLIEVMVATAVVLILVVMIGALFRQASSSWDSGYATAEGDMAVRAVVGALTRDLATAVDGRLYEEWETPIMVESEKVDMYCFRPEKMKNGTYHRAIHHITYQGGDKVRRTDEVLTAGGWVPANKKASSTIYGGGTAANGARCTFSAANPIDDALRTRNYEKRSRFKNEFAWEIPSVKVRVELTRTGQFSGLSVVSWGPDGRSNDSEDSDDPDDIIVK